MWHVRHSSVQTGSIAAIADFIRIPNSGSVERRKRFVSGSVFMSHRFDICTVSEGYAGKELVQVTQTFLAKKVP